MTRTVQELSDRLDLSDLVIRYATCIDARDFHGLDSVFTPDARVGYEASGGPADAYPAIRDWLAETLPVFSATQHLVSNVAVELDGDAARGRVMCFNPMVLDLSGGKDRPHTMFYGLWYRLTFARTADGWRITALEQEKAYDHNVPRG